MRLKEYLHVEKPKKIAILMLNDNDEIEPFLYNKGEYTMISKQLLKMEIMDVMIETSDEVHQIWVM